MSLVSYLCIYIYMSVYILFALVQLDEYFASNQVLQFVLGGCCSQPWRGFGPDMERYPMKCGNVGEETHDSLANFWITLFFGGKKTNLATPK